MESISWLPGFLIKTSSICLIRWTAPAKVAKPHEEVPSASRNRHRWRGRWYFGRLIGICDLVATRPGATARIAGNRSWIAWHQIVRRRNGNGRLGSGAPLFHCVRGCIDLLPGESQGPVFDETAVCFRRVLWDRRLHCMYWIVLPAAFSTFRHRPSNELLELAIHICLIGLPTAFIVRRYAVVTD